MGWTDPALWPCCDLFLLWAWLGLGCHHLVFPCGGWPVVVCPCAGLVWVCSALALEWLAVGSSGPIGAGPCLGSP
jgi:hypothetical protein